MHASRKGPISLLAPGPREETFRFDGQGHDLFGLYVKNVLLTLSTLGVYRFWAKVSVRRFRYQHSEFADARFDYHATGKEKFVGFLKGLVLLGPLLIGLWFLNGALEPRLGPDQAFAVCTWTFLLIMLLLRPLIIVGSQAFNLSRTSWSNMRLRFTGRIGPLYGIYGRDLLLTLVTLGFYYPWLDCNIRRFKMSNTCLGDSSLDYDGEGQELFPLAIGGLLLSYVTLGLFLPWYHALLQRFHASHTLFQGNRFRSELTGGQLFLVYLASILLIVPTLGLALPWATTMYYREVSGALAYEGELDIDSLRAAYDSRASALMEGLGEAGEAIGDLGDLFGG